MTLTLRSLARSLTLLISQPFTSFIPILSPFLPISSHVASLTASRPANSVLFVVDAFGALNSVDDASASYETLGQVLQSNGYHVTVLYVGAENPQMASITALYLERGVTITR